MNRTKRRTLQVDGTIRIWEKPLYIYVPVPDVAYIRSQSNYVTISAKGKQYLVTQTGKEIRSRIRTEPFLEIRNGWLVNLDHVRLLNDDGDRIMMADESVFHVAKKFQADVQEAWLRYSLSNPGGPASAPVAIVGYGSLTDSQLAELHWTLHNRQTVGECIIDRTAQVITGVIVARQGSFETYFDVTNGDVSMRCDKHREPFNNQLEYFRRIAALGLTY